MKVKVLDQLRAATTVVSVFGSTTGASFSTLIGSVIVPGVPSSPSVITAMAVKLPRCEIAKVWRELENDLVAPSRVSGSEVTTTPFWTRSIRPFHLDWSAVSPGSLKVPAKPMVWPWGSELVVEEKDSRDGATLLTLSS